MLQADGSVVTWGYDDSGGDLPDGHKASLLSSGVSTIYSTHSAFTQR